MSYTRGVATFNRFSALVNDFQLKLVLLASTTIQPFVSTVYRFVVEPSHCSFVTLDTKVIVVSVQPAVQTHYKLPALQMPELLYPPFDPGYRDMKPLWRRSLHHPQLTVVIGLPVKLDTQKLDSILQTR